MFASGGILRTVLFFVNTFCTSYAAFRIAINAHRLMLWQSAVSARIPAPEVSSPSGCLLHGRSYRPSPAVAGNRQKHEVPQSLIGAARSHCVAGKPAGARRADGIRFMCAKLSAVRQLPAAETLFSMLANVGPRSMCRARAVFVGAARAVRSAIFPIPRSVIWSASLVIHREVKEPLGIRPPSGSSRR